MKIRKAEKKDIPRILALLGQVLQIHAQIVLVYGNIDRVILLFQ